MLDELIEPIWVTIEVLSRASRQQDEDAHESIPGSYPETRVTLEAQVAWDVYDQETPEEGGDREKYDGVLVIRARDMTTAGVEIQRGDRIVAIGSNSHNFYVWKRRPFGHWTELNGNAYWHLYFRDRSPTHRVQ